MEPLAVLGGLLDELRASAARAQSILDRSGRLRRHAVDLSAAALVLRRQSERLLPHASAPTDVSGDLRGVRVLVVEGGTEVAKGLSSSLSALGAEVRAARSVPDALDAYLAILPDVLANSVPPAQFAATILGVLRK